MDKQIEQKVNFEFEAFVKEFKAFKLPRFSEFPDVGLYMDQVVSLTEKYLKIMQREDEKQFITPSMINNYVKMGVMPAPIQKRYTPIHLAYLVMICLLKQVLTINEIKLLLDFSDELLESEYDRFCKLQEKAVKSNAMENANDCMELALFSLTGKIYAQKLIDLKEKALKEKEEADKKLKEEEEKEKKLEEARQKEREAERKKLEAEEAKKKAKQEKEQEK